MYIDISFNILSNCYNFEFPNNFSDLFSARFHFTFEKINNNFIREASFPSFCFPFFTLNIIKATTGRAV